MSPYLRKQLYCGVLVLVGSLLPVQAGVVPTIKLSKKVLRVPRLEIKLEKVGITAIEAQNNYSENITIKMTVIYPTGHLKAGQTVANFNGTFTVAENHGISNYYDGANGATLLPKTFAAQNGVATILIKSVSNSNNVLGPPPAEILISANAANVVANTISVPQWVDENGNNFIDWLDLRSNAILTCFKGKPGEVGVVAGSVTGLSQGSFGCGTTPLGTTGIQISPVCQTPNRHRLNTANELSDTVIHEARHAWVNKELKRNDVGVNDDGNPSTPSNDDDQDRWAEVLGGFTDANDITETSSPSKSDKVVDPDPSSTVQEIDASDFAAAHRTECP